MLATVFEQLIILLTNFFGGTANLSDLSLFWINGIAVVATIAVAIAPIYILVKVMRWFVGE